MPRVTEITFLGQGERDFLRLFTEAEERTPARGASFSAEVEKVPVLLRRMPRLGRVVGDPYRRMKLSRFPQSLIYTFEGSRIFIHTIASNHEPLEMLLQRLRRG
jgi:plasmid stabilization system protein ParE